MKNIKIFLKNLHEISFYIFYFCSLLFFTNKIYFNSNYINEILNYPLFIIFALLIQSEFLKNRNDLKSSTLNKLAIINVFMLLSFLIIDLTN